MLPPLIRHDSRNTRLTNICTICTKSRAYDGFVDRSILEQFVAVGNIVDVYSVFGAYVDYVMCKMYVCVVQSVRRFEGRNGLNRP